MRAQPRSKALAAMVVGVFLAASPAGAATWSAGAPVPPVRTQTAMVYDSAHRVMVQFGGGTGFAYVREPWLYDGKRWSAGPAAPTAAANRGLHGMAYDAARRRVVVFGGSNIISSLNDTWEFDGLQWIAGPAAPAALTPRGGSVMTYDGARQRIVLFGGGDGSGFRNDTWEYEGTAWTAGPAPPGGLLPRFLAGMAYDSGRSRVVLCCGYDGTTALNDAWEYDGISWTAAPGGPFAGREALGMAYDAARGRTVVYGGSDAPFTTWFSDTWEYDGISWTAGVPMPASLGRSSFGMAYDVARARVVVFGGYNGTSFERNDAWEYDGTAWTPALDSPPAREAHATAFDSARDVTVLMGGANGALVPGDTYEYDGYWRRGPAAPFTARQKHAMAYDAAIGRVVLFGGNDGALRDDTWLYDGTSWTAGPLTPPGLTAREGHAMAYDATPGRLWVVLFGGRDGGGLRNDTWHFNGVAWVPGALPAPGLMPRHVHVGAYDSAPGHNFVVFFGGESATGLLNDTWHYDGTSWTPGGTAPPGLTPRRASAAAYDAGRGVTVLFGGDDARQNDTWLYDGSNWTQGPLPGPTARYAHAMAYDSTRGVTVLFGGNDGIAEGDTWELGAKWIHLLGAGLGPSNPNRVRLFDELGQATTIDFAAYAAGKWGVNVAASELDGAVLREILTGPGPGEAFGPQVRGFRRSSTPIAKINYYAYGTLKYGVNVGSGSIDVDAYEEIVSGAGPGPVFGPHVRGFNFDNASVAAIAKVSYFAYSTLKYGVNVSLGDVDRDLYGEINTGPGPGAIFGPQVRGWNVDGGTVTSIAKINFNAFTTAQYGVNLAAGNADGDGFAEIICAPGPGGSASFQGVFRGFNYDGLGTASLPGYDVTAFTSIYGGRAGLGDIVGDPTLELLAGAGRDPAAAAVVKPYSYDGTALQPAATSFDPFPASTYGVNPGSGQLGY